MNRIEEMDNLYDYFVEIHKPQLTTSGVPELFWPSLFKKLLNDVLDAGNSFQLMSIDYDGSEVQNNYPVFALHVIREDGIRTTDANEIYLIDHAWTFKANQIKSHLVDLPSLTERMCIITGIELDDPDRINKLEKEIWKYCQSYSVQAEGYSIEDRMPIWYVMDEVGSAVNHSDNPNFRIIPFIYLPTQTTYSLLFPIKDCNKGEAVTRDFVENISRNDKSRNALLLPWKYIDFTSESFEQKEPDEEYFTSGHVPEILPENTTQAPNIKLDQPLKVYCEYDIVIANLTSSSFELVDKPELAEIVWSTKHFKDFKDFSVNFPNSFVNQFPYEYVLTIKDLLSIICKRRTGKHHNPDTLETFPKWLPTTYNLKTELIEFVSYYQNRKLKKLNNHWIIKPWNLARGLDTEITDDISKILRLQTTGPKIAQKYIENPVTFYRNDLDDSVKFDIRYVILLKSVEPLEAYVHNKFYLRFANKVYSLDNLDDYEKHFTVMNYNDKTTLKHVRCEEFVELWHKQYPKHNWTDVEHSILEMFKEVLQCAISRPPPCGIADFKQSRALYAADLMLSWEDDQSLIQPKLLEINWMPDCKRACEYYPEFYNEIFKLLFLNEINLDQFKIIVK